MPCLAKDPRIVSLKGGTGGTPIMFTPAELLLAQGEPTIINNERYPLMWNDVFKANIEEDTRLRAVAGNSMHMILQGTFMLYCLSKTKIRSGASTGAASIGASAEGPDSGDLVI